ncbi:GGDEF domain-containing protein [Curvibacter sp. RS43]|uniref:GGDEF domain-containing protein n=1 Tax=Curvibacter microcysteis TaxID=3026419 RepID=UPI00236154C3|nr:GGDEF domain-containing protein [Curvibacter sp. RS43]MDD0808929.1 GGDEF domain-containing protein [Curvibacter sp. RS43]
MPMSVLDPRSIITLSALMGLVMAMVLFFVRRSYPRKLQGGLRLLAASPLAWFTAAGLYGLRDVAPDWLTVVLANLILLLGTLLFSVGLQHFFQGWARWRLWAGLILASTPVVAWFTLVEPNYGVRLLVVNGLLCGLFLQQIRFLMQQPTSFGLRFTMVAMGAQTSVLVLRMVSVAAGLAGHSMMEPGLLQVVYVSSNAMSVQMLTIGAVLLATERLRREFEHVASHDSLTEALTRRAVLELAENELARLQRYGEPLSLMMLDLDHFKDINDLQGHQQGDAVLVDFANRTRAVLRRPDQLGRYGGEEFLVLLPATDARSARVVAERVRLAPPSRPELACTVSVGLTTALGPDDSLDAMLSRADQALYLAKREGRNRVCEA